MDFPKPPDDPEMTNIIDKLANFVARNGLAFEQMTKQKQQENPRFAFLFGGEYFNYYQYKLTTAQAALQNQQLLEQGEQQLCSEHGQQQAAAPQEQDNETTAAAFQQQIFALQTQIAEQITESENNLAAQYQSMMKQQQTQIEELILAKRQEELKSLSQTCEIDLALIDEKIQPIIDSCTKDAIMQGKTWIMLNATSDDHCRLISQYFLDRVFGQKAKQLTSKEGSFSLRLHLIYLMYDIIHHCVRRGVDTLKENLERVVVPIFCIAKLGAEESDQTEKLDKLLKLWENHGYLNKEILQKLHDPALSLSAYQASLIMDNAAEVTQVTASIQSQYSALQKQHEDFTSHLNSNLISLQQQLASLTAQEQRVNCSEVPSIDPVSNSQMVSHPYSTSGQLSLSGTSFAMGPTGGDMVPPGMVGRPAIPPFCQPPPSFDTYFPPPGPPPTPTMTPQPPPPTMTPQPPPPTMTPQPPPQQFDYGHGIGAMPTEEFALPDFSKPPPGFPPTDPGLPSALSHPRDASVTTGPPSSFDLVPPVPYFELPAGLMVPLVKISEVGYKPLDPSDIRLPLPAAPTERLLAAVDAFYTPPSREHPRDSEGWEKLGLYEYFKAKKRARKTHKRRRRRRYSRSWSRSQSRSRSRSRSNSATPPRRCRFDLEGEERYSTSHSETPLRRRQFDAEAEARNRRSRSRSRSASPSPSPRRRSRSRSSSRSRSRSSHHRSRSATPEMPRHRRMSRDRSPTPPNLNSGLDMGPALPPGDQRLGMNNKGHQLLMKMGWSGKGLGATEQGIVDPVQAAEVRDKMDLRKGIGIDLRDPFEQFRKIKAEGFIKRMRLKADIPAPPEDTDCKKSMTDRLGLEGEGCSHHYLST